MSQLVILRQNMAFFQDAPVEIRIFLNEKNSTIKIICFTFKYQDAPKLISSIIFEFMTIIEYSLFKANYIYKVKKII